MLSLEPCIGCKQHFESASGQAGVVCRDCKWRARASITMTGSVEMTTDGFVRAITHVVVAHGRSRRVAVENVARMISKVFKREAITVTMHVVYLSDDPKRPL